MDYDLLLEDRIGVIKDAIKKYGEDNFYISFSGGKDSTIIHYLVDLAIPNNRIPRVFINTGVEYQDIVKFVQEMTKKDKRFVILKPTKSIKQVCETYGYPFKSKEHSTKIGMWQNGRRTKSVLKYKEGGDDANNLKFGCPKQLMYQFEDDFKLKLSGQCCYKLKKEPIHKWEKENNKPIAITGMRKDEGGQRANIKGCIITKNSKVIKFHPLLVVSEEWEEWFIKTQNIKLCKLYYEPFNFKRTGCKGCPFALHLQEQLEVMQRLLPNEYKQCEMLWKPVYDEYRRINYRLKKNEQLKLF